MGCTAGRSSIASDEAKASRVIAMPAGSDPVELKAVLLLGSGGNWERRASRPSSISCAPATIVCCVLDGTAGLRKEVEAAPLRLRKELACARFRMLPLLPAGSRPTFKVASVSASEASLSDSVMTAGRVRSSIRD